MTAAFYRRSGDLVIPTDYVTGPWDPEMSHAGPPAGLLASAIARSAPDMGVTRITYEIPRGVPKVPATIGVSELRPGTKVRMVEATLEGTDGTALMTARAWMMRITEAMPTSDPFPLDVPPPAECEPLTFPLPGIGYMHGVEMRRIDGDPFRRGGRAAIWIRSTLPLVDGEEDDPHGRMGLFGDLGNGIAAVEPMQELMAINTDLTLYIARPPVAEWMAIRAAAVTDGRGLGMTHSLVYDASGFVGAANQSIFIDRR